jgi:hypothetical protein
MRALVEHPAGPPRPSPTSGTGVFAPSVSHDCLGSRHLVSFRGRIPTARMLAALRIGVTVTPHAARTRYRPGRGWRPRRTASAAG